MTATPPVPPAARDQGATVTAGFLGWTLDAFDFFLVVMTLTAIAKEFGKSDADIAASIGLDRKSTRLNSSHGYISYAVFCLKKKTHQLVNHGADHHVELFRGGLRQ